MTRPVLFLDVDGVLSPLVSDPTVWDGWERVAGVPFHLVLSRDLGARLADLDVDLVWLTTWEHDANTVIAEHLGWKPTDVLTREDAEAAPDGLHRRLWWKPRALLGWLRRRPAPFVWIDDDLRGHDEEVRDWAHEHGVAHLILSPDPLVGLTPDDLDRIESFLADVGGAGEA